MDKIAIIGCGPHFKKRYFEILKDLQDKKIIKIIFLIDLESKQKDVEEFFNKQKFIIPCLKFFPDKCRNDLTLENILDYTKNISFLNEITQVIISCEPKAHKVYVMWAIENNWHIFIDKPLTAFNSIKYSNSLYQDYIDIKKKLVGKNINFVVSCERRYHLGYKFVTEYIKNFISKYQTPINFIDIHFAGGKWLLPNEYITHENHPFKYGYGILLHSGYHYLDLFIQLLSLNNASYSSSSFDINVMYNTPQDNLHGLKKDFYKKIFNLSEFDFYSQKRNITDLLGEVNIFINGKVKKQEYTCTNFSIRLVGESLSLRSNFIDNVENCVEEGRIRQENVIIHLGPLCSIHIRSLPYKKLDPLNNLDENFEIVIMNHPKLTNEQPITRIEKKDLINCENISRNKRSLNVSARQNQLMDFINGKDSNSSFVSHQNSIKFLSLVYCTMKEMRECT